MKLRTLFIWIVLLSYSGEVRSESKISPFKIAFGSCIKQPHTPIWDSIVKTSPDAFIFLGDNVYLDAEDFKSRERIDSKYKTLFVEEGIKKLLSTTKIFTTWDDHDFGPGNSDSYFEEKNITKEAFFDAWGHVQNPPGLEGSLAHEGVVGPVHFLITDDRTYRVNPGFWHKERMFGEKQLQWLVDRVSSSTSPVVLIASGTQILCSRDKSECFNEYPDEREKLLHAAAHSKARVLFVSGDRHYGEILKTKVDGRELLEISASPLSARHCPAGLAETEENRLGLVLDQDLFGLISIMSTTPQVNVEAYLKDKNGRMLLAYRE